MKEIRLLEKEKEQRRQEKAKERSQFYKEQRAQKKAQGGQLKFKFTPELVSNEQIYMIFCVHRRRLRAERLG
jgi:hypothetical protein